MPPSPFVVSGIGYPVKDIAGSPSTDLAQFVGETSFSIDNHGMYRVNGCGSLDSNGVRFYEKDDAGRGRDVRVWRIVRNADGSFTAEHAAAI
jgi:hypothetical protein